MEAFAHPGPVEVTLAEVISHAPADSWRTATRSAFVVVAVWSMVFGGVRSHTMGA